MKTLRNLFAQTKSEKSIANFSDRLTVQSILMIKGGDGDDTDKDSWPPVTGSTGSN